MQNFHKRYRSFFPINMYSISSRFSKQENENLLIERCPPHFDVLRTILARFFPPYLEALFLFATNFFSFSPFVFVLFFFFLFFLQIYVTRERTTLRTEVDRTESERISRRTLPCHERQNRILQNILWHGRTWPGVRHKSWPTRHTTTAATSSAWHLVASGHQHRSPAAHSCLRLIERNEYETDIYFYIKQTIINFLQT